MKPRVTVLMPVRDGLPWLEAALTSLSNQTLREIEILALEDGSTDATSQVLAAWPDDRLRTIHTGGIGVAAALRIGLREACAPLVARQDADDISTPDRLEKQVAFLERYHHIDLVGCTAEYIDASGRPLDNAWVQTIREQQDVAVTPEQIRDLMPLTCCLTHGSIVARAEVLRSAGSYRQSTAPVEDYDLWLRLLPQAQLAKLPERLYVSRVHDRQVSVQTRDQQIRQTLAAKLAYVRRLCPALPTPARLAIAGTGRAAEHYAAVAPEHGFVPVAALPALRRTTLSFQTRPRVRRRAVEGWDVLVITDLGALDTYKTLFGEVSEETGLRRIGNVFVKAHLGVQVGDGVLGVAA